MIARQLVFVRMLVRKDNDMRNVLEYFVCRRILGREDSLILQLLEEPVIEILHSLARYSKKDVLGINSQIVGEVLAFPESDSPGLVLIPLILHPQL